MVLNPAVLHRSYRIDASDAFEIGGELVRKFVDAIDDDNPLHREPERARAAGHRDLIAPLTFPTLIPYARPHVNPIDDPEVGADKPRGVHAGHRIEQFRPMTRGDRVVMTTTIADIRAAGPHEIIEMRSDVATVEGEPLSRITHVTLFRGERSGGPRAEADRATSPRSAVPIDARYEPQTYSLVLLDLQRYSGASGEYGAIHWSERAARAAGLEGIIAHGMYTMTKAAQALTFWFGDSGRIRDFSVRFSAPLVVDELVPVELTVAVAAARERADGLLELELQVRSGDLALLTAARALVAPA